MILKERKTSSLLRWLAQLERVCGNTIVASRLRFGTRGAARY